MLTKIIYMCIFMNIGILSKYEQVQQLEKNPKIYKPPFIFHLNLKSF